MPAFKLLELQLVSNFTLELDLAPELVYIRILHVDVKDVRRHIVGFSAILQVAAIHAHLNMQHLLPIAFNDFRLEIIQFMHGMSVCVRIRRKHDT